MKVCENYYSLQYLKQKFTITPLLMLFDFRRTKRYKLNHFESLLKLVKSIKDQT